MSESNDPTEGPRRQAIAAINNNPRIREELEAVHGQVWSTGELTTDFTVHDFLAPFVFVTKKDTGEKGTLLFQHHPRFFYGFEAT